MAAAGVSVRAVAGQVFGDVRFRGRVERILACPAEAAESPEALGAREAELRVFAGLSRAGQLRWLLERQLKALAVRDEPTSARELRTLLDVERRLLSLEQMERLRPRPRSDEAG